MLRGGGIHAGDDRGEDGERALGGMEDEARDRQSHAPKSGPAPARRADQPPRRQRGGVARRAPHVPPRHHHARGQPRLRLPHRRRHRHRPLRGPGAHDLRRRLPRLQVTATQPRATPHEAGHGQGDRGERGGDRRGGGRRRYPRRAAAGEPRTQKQARRRGAPRRPRIGGERSQRRRRRITRGGHDEHFSVQIQRQGQAVDNLSRSRPAGRREEPLERGVEGGEPVLRVPGGEGAGAGRRELQGVPQQSRGHRGRERRG